MSGTRRRRIGIAVGLAAVAIVVTIILLGSSDGASPPDRYTIAANRMCRTARRDIAEARRRHRRASNGGDPAPFARSLFTAIGHLHIQLGKLSAPSDKIADAVEFEQAELEVEQPIIDLIHISSSGGQQAEADARQLESTGRRLDELASALGLAECARLELSL